MIGALCPFGSAHSCGAFLCCWTKFTRGVHFYQTGLQSSLDLTHELWQPAKSSNAVNLGRPDDSNAA